MKPQPTDKEVIAMSASLQDVSSRLYGIAVILGGMMAARALRNQELADRQWSKFQDQLAECKAVLDMILE